MKVTLALTHFNRFNFLTEAIHGVIDDPRITEIVISDDCSTDGSYAALQRYFAPYKKVKLFRNHRNMDCYVNKRMAVQRASHDWVILFDSDNVMDPSYLNALENVGIWDPNTIYCPEFAEPSFDYRVFSKMVVTAQNVSSLMSRPKFQCLLNTANYLVSRQGFLDVWDGSVNPHTADSIFQIYNWLKAGKRLFVVPGLRYYHRVHAGSHYKLNVHKTGQFSGEVEMKLRQLR